MEQDFWLAFDLLRSHKDHEEFTVVRDWVQQVRWGSACVNCVVGAAGAQGVSMSQLCGGCSRCAGGGHRGWLGGAGGCSRCAGHGQTLGGWKVGREMHKVCWGNSDLKGGEQLLYLHVKVNRDAHPH